MSRRFTSQDYRRYKRLGLRWRRPRGRQSKLMVRKAGSGIVPRIGCRTPKSVRGTSKIIDGKGHSLVSVHVVHSLKEVDALSASLAGAQGVSPYIIIASAVGKKKTDMLAEKAKQLGMHVVNAKKVKAAEKLGKVLQKSEAMKETKKEGAKVEGEQHA